MVEIKMASFGNHLLLSEYLLNLQFQYKKLSQNLVLGVGNVLDIYIFINPFGTAISVLYKKNKYYI